MKIRTNRSRIMAKIKANNRYRWFVTAALSGSDERRIVRERIQATVDLAFPELKGVYVTN